EKALKKMQDSRGAANAAPAPAGVVTTVRRPDVTGLEGSPVAAAAATLPAALRSEPQAVPVPRSSGKFVTLNLSALRSAGLVPVADEERRAASEYRQIKRPLIAGALGRGPPAVPNGRVIMVASALPGEGKSFTSVNLAFNMALEKDTTVLLVDADLPKP